MHTYKQSSSIGSCVRHLLRVSCRETGGEGRRRQDQYSPLPTLAYTLHFPQDFHSPSRGLSLAGNEFSLLECDLFGGEF